MAGPRPTHDWTTPDDVRAEVERLWSRGVLSAAALSAHLEDVRLQLVGGRSDAIRATDIDSADDRDPSLKALFFPLRLRLRRPKTADLGRSFEAVRLWIADLESASRATIGHGYEITWEEINNRQLGRNRLPAALTLPTLGDALSLIGRTADAGMITDLAQSALQRFPDLATWLSRRSLAVLEHAAAWERLLDCLTWFQANPHSGLYARQINIAGVDSKFIEVHKPILAELLDLVLPAEAIMPTGGGLVAFEARYGLAARPALVRFRVLDPRLAIHGLTDMTVRVDELARLRLQPRRVVIVENDITGLAFPFVEGALLIFARGYAIEQLAGIDWLRDCPIDYWGDIDTNGFAILSRARALLPQVRSLLMDRETLLAHRAAWSFETAPHIAELAHLTPEEASLYDELRRDRLGSGVRLEQERIPMYRVPCL